MTASAGKGRPVSLKFGGQCEAVVEKTRRWVMKVRSTLLVAFGMIVGLLLGVFLMTPSHTEAAARSQYKVERLDGMQVRDPAALQEVLEQRAGDGWYLQALDHETVVFRRAPAAKTTPTPEP
jgi:hypothetical protein